MILPIALFLFAAAQSNPEQLFQKALESQQRGDYAAAVAEYRQLLQIQPGLFPALANLGASLTHLGRFDEAIDQYTAALKQEPQNNALRMNLALAYYKKGDYANASDHLRALHQDAPADARIATLLGDCLSHLDRNDQALALLAPLEATRPDDADLAFALGNALVRGGRKRDGVERIERAASALKSPEAYRLAAETWFDLSEFEAARKAVNEALALQPDLPGLHTLEGMILQSVGDRPAAAEALMKALKANPNDFRANLYLGAVEFTDRNLKDARIHLDHALRLDPGSALARYELALVQRSTGQEADAVKNLEQVVKANPKWLPVHVELAALYYRVRRPEDGMRERKIVDRLSEEQQKQENPGASLPKAPTIP
ncbi:MAG TPA: tetratricopeptide repeat protein [Bryobacteraceae bacterium]|jgi:tetratricopeptide (TPR) repeat protein